MELSHKSFLGSRSGSSVGTLNLPSQSRLAPFSVIISLQTPNGGEQLENSYARRQRLHSNDKRGAETLIAKVKTELSRIVMKNQPFNRKDFTIPAIVKKILTEYYKYITSVSKSVSNQFYNRRNLKNRHHPL